MKRFLLVVIALVVGMTIAASLPASGGGRDTFRSSLAASPGANRPIRSVSSGGVPWVVAPGSDTRLTEDGRLRVDVMGLLITGTGTNLDGTTGPVHQVVAALTCTNPSSGDAGAPIVVATDPVPLSVAGDARIDQRLDISLGPCLAPVVLILANGSSGPWIATSGF